MKTPPRTDAGNRPTKRRGLVWCSTANSRLARRGSTTTVAVVVVSVLYVQAAAAMPNRMPFATFGTCGESIANGATIAVSGGNRFAAAYLLDGSAQHRGGNDPTAQLLELGVDDGVDCCGCDEGSGSCNDVSCSEQARDDESSSRAVCDSPDHVDGVRPKIIITEEVDALVAPWLDIVPTEKICSFIGGTMRPYLTTCDRE